MPNARDVQSALQRHQESLEVSHQSDEAVTCIDMGVSKNRGGPPKSSILIGFFIIFTIHFGGKILPFLETPTCWPNLRSSM